MSKKEPANPERSFGVSVGGVMVAIAVALWWRGRFQRAEVVGAIGMVLVVLGVARPMLLRLPSAIWWRFARVLAYVNARIILTILFVLVLVPLGAIWRLIGRDVLGRKRASWAGWSVYPARYKDSRHYERMF